MADDSMALSNTLLNKADATDCIRFERYYD